MIFLAILALSLILRAYKIGHNDLWYDEALTALISTHHGLLSSDTQPPLYTLVTSVFINLLGKKEFVFRLPAMIFGVLSILGIYRLGRILFNKNTSLFAALLLAISPIHIWYSQEARAYTLAIFFSIYFIYLFALLIKEDKFFLWLLLTVTFTLGLYTNYFIILLAVPAFFILIALRKNNLLWKLVISLSLGLAFIYPWIVASLSRRLSPFIRGNFWIPEPRLDTLINTWDIFNLGYNSCEAHHAIMRLITLFLAVTCIFSSKRRLKFVLCILVLLVVPIFSAFVISYWKPIYLPRYMLLFLPVYLLIISRSIFFLRKKILRVIFIICILYFVLNSVKNYYSNYAPTNISVHTGTYVKKPFKPLIEYIKQNIKNGDIVGFSSLSLGCPLEYYWEHKAEIYHFYISDFQEPYTLEIINNLKNYKPDLLVDLSEACFSPLPLRIWIISASWARGRYLDEESLAVKKWFEQRYPKVQEREFDGIQVSLFNIAADSE